MLTSADFAAVVTALVETAEAYHDCRDRHAALVKTLEVPK